MIRLKSRRVKILLGALALILLLFCCGLAILASDPPEDAATPAVETPQIEEATSTAVADTATPAPTDTPEPTATPAPTDTPEPAETPTAEPTETRSPEEESLDEYRLWAAGRAAQYSSLMGDLNAVMEEASVDITLLVDDDWLLRYKMALAGLRGNGDAIIAKTDVPAAAMEFHEKFVEIALVTNAATVSLRNGVDNLDPAEIDRGTLYLEEAMRLVDELPSLPSR